MVETFLTHSTYLIYILFERLGNGLHMACCSHPYLGRTFISRSTDMQRHVFNARHCVQIDKHFIIRIGLRRCFRKNITRFFVIETAERNIESFFSKKLRLKHFYMQYAHTCYLKRGLLA